MRAPLVSEPVLLVQNRAAHHHCNLSSDRCGASRPTHGCQNHRPGLLQGNLLGIHPKSRALQRQRARSHHLLRGVLRRRGAPHHRRRCAESSALLLGAGGHFPILRRRPCLHHRPVAPHKRSVGAGAGVRVRDDEEEL